MSNRRPLTVSQMLIALISCKSEDEFIHLWNAYVDLMEHGFISRSQWLRFYDQAEDWYFDSTSNRVLPCPVEGDLF